MVYEESKYNSVTMAKFIVGYANNRGFSVNMTKVQKLLYIAYGLCLAVSDTRLVDEHPQAWPYGPVFPTTRNKLLKMDMYSISMEAPEFTEIREDDDTMELMDLVFGTFGKWTASELTGWSHKEGSPWENAVSSAGFKWGDRMNDRDIKAYFKSIIYEKESI